MRSDFAATSASADWRLGAWSATTGHASVATFFEQRLYAAATSAQPQTFWASQTADFENFKPDDDAGTVEDDDALDYTLSADEVNAIRWLVPGREVLVETRDLATAEPIRVRYRDEEILEITPETTVGHINHPMWKWGEYPSPEN